VLARLKDGWGDAALRALAAVEERDATAAGHSAVRLSELAEGERFRLAAAMFAEAAALASLDDPARALRVATLARDRADHGAAEWWGERAARSAQAQGVWITATRGFARVADAAERRGAFGKAVVYRRKEIQAARRGELPDMHSRALHSLFAALLHAGERQEAAKVFAKVWEVYGPEHPRLWGLANDAAFYLLKQGEAVAALPLLLAAIEEAEEPGIRMVVSANLATAAALTGREELSVRATGAALQAISRADRGGDTAWTLVELATAATRRGAFESARAWAEEGLLLAEQREEETTAAAARALLAELNAA
jgi:tetratricopeptide (TPR) repeat protein